MAITTSVVTIDTAGTLVVSPTTDAQRVWLHNLEPNRDIGSYSRNGYMYFVDQIFPVNSLATVRFSFTTGVTGAQLEFWNISTSNDNILGQLHENATITTNGTTIPAINLNRNFSDTHNAILQGATSITGGTVIMQELIGADKVAGGSTSSLKTVTLKPSTQYGFSFYNSGNQTTNVHFQLGFVELYNGYNDIWINGLHDQTIKLRGGESIQLQLEQAEGIWASSIRNGTKIAVMRMD